MTILALDLATKTGWALRYSATEIYHGTESFERKSSDGAGMRFLKFRQWLKKLAEEHGPIEAVYYEDVRRHKGVAAAHVYGGLKGVLMAWAEERGIPYAGVTVQEIKFAATGKKVANKEAVIAAMRARGFSPEDDNAADALAILVCVKAERGAA